MHECLLIFTAPHYYYSTPTQLGKLFFFLLKRFCRRREQETKLRSAACTGRGWDLVLCDTALISFSGSGAVTVPRCVGDPLARLGTASALLLVGLLLAWAPGKHTVPRLLGPAVIAVQPFIMWAMQPGAARVSASPPAYYVATSLLALLALLSEVWQQRSRRRFAAASLPLAPAAVMITAANFSSSRDREHYL